MIESVDVSWPQGNYHPGAEAGVFIAATSGDGGKNFVQATLAQDVANARADGKEVAFYHFNGPETLDPVASAQFFWAAIKPYFRPGDLTALDVESSSGGKVPHVSPGWALAFQTELARLRGLSTQAARVGTYGNRSDMRQSGWGAVEAAGSWLWLAAPGGYPENTAVGEWSHWTILQYSSAGGIDRDQSQLSFSQIAGAATTKPTQGDDEMEKWEAFKKVPAAGQAPDTTIYISRNRAGYWALSGQSWNDYKAFWDANNIKLGPASSHEANVQSVINPSAFGPNLSNLK